MMHSASDGVSAMERAYFTYILRCADGTYYTGYTVDDVNRRVAAHNAGKGAKYTRSRTPVTLVWSREWDSGHDARSAEARIKTLTRKQKEELIQGKRQL
jgi:putative endonuclease